MKRVFVFLLIYPFAIMLLALPVCLYDLHDQKITEGQARECIAQERIKLGITPNVHITLVLDDESPAYTEWQKVGGPFTITIGKNFLSANVVRHEMYHISRAQRCQIRGTGWNPIVFWIRYMWVEEPLALLYETLHIRADFWAWTAPANRTVLFFLSQVR